MSAKNALEKDVAIVLAKINDITRNQFIIDLMIFIQGVNFLVHPEKAHKGIIEAISIAIFFATTGIIIGFFVSHGFNKRNRRSIIFSFIFMGLSIAVYFLAGVLAPAFHYFLAFAIIVSGTTNILSSYHLIKLTHAKKTLKTTRQDKTIQNVSSALKHNVKLEAERVLSPAIIFSDRLTKFRYGQLFVNFVLIIIGIVMLFFRFQANAVLLRISGGALIFSAISDCLALVWTHRESASVKELTHYNKQ